MITGLKFQTGPKSEWLEQATAISRGEIAVSVADIPQLLAWMQDMNWPGAAEAAAVVLKFGKDAIGPMRDALRSGDVVWQFWILSYFRNEFNKLFWSELEPELIAIARNFDEEGAHISAMIILAAHRLVNRSTLNEWMRESMAGGVLDAEDYSYLKLALSK